MNVYMFRRVLSIEAIKRVNNLLIQYVIVLVPVECGSLLVLGDTPKISAISL